MGAGAGAGAGSCLMGSCLTGEVLPLGGSTLENEFGFE
jgi:hypothetical protein